MHDNPQANPGLVLSLPDHRVIALSGRDAAAFAQAQFMNDLKVLAPGRWQWSGWLTPKGRVIALFALLKFDEDAVWLLLPDADPVTFAAALQRFVFRSKVAIAVRDDLRVEGAFAAPLQARGNDFAGDSSGGVELDLGADAGPRTLRILPTSILPTSILPSSTLPSSTASRDPAWLVRWTFFDIEHGLVRLPASQSDHWTPQQLSLERLNAFSVKKGCYPGQEIVARTHFLGKVKRGLALFEAATALHAGEDLKAAGEPFGHVIASADDGERHLGLAVVPLERDARSFHAGDVEVRELPLGEGLAR